jgi:hypothetical protein
MSTATPEPAVVPPSAATDSEPRRGGALRHAGLLLWAVATVALLAVTAVAIERKVTWYLAVDQLGYLLFARDLLHGKLFHDWPLANVVASLLPDRTDVLAQTYVWDHGRLYSRYAPGYPIVVAAWIGAFGDAAVHALNPVLFLLLLLVVIALGWRLHRSLWRGTAAVALVMLCPTGASLWALTPTRDMASHLLGFVALLALAGRGPLRVRTALGAALALGYAASVRPDAVLYAVPALALGIGRWWRHRPGPSLATLAPAAALGVLLGLAPSLAYYWAATGNPFVPTQSMELTEFLGAPETPPAPDAADARVGYPSEAWHGTTSEPVSGGGLRLDYLPATLPGNLEKVRTAYGDVLLGLAGLGLVVMAVRRPAFAIAAASYVVSALLFYSCWGRPYGRYLIGIWILVPIFIVEGVLGTLELVRRAARRGAGVPAAQGAAVVAVALLAAYAVAAPAPDATALVPVTRLLAVGGAVALVAAAVSPGRRVATVAAPVLGVALVVLAGGRLWETLGTRAPFQRAQAARAADVVRHAVVTPAVVVTTEAAGRPMENLEYYAGVSSVYLTDLERWHVTVDEVVLEALVAEVEPYILIPRALSERERILSTLRGQFQLELVDDIPPERVAEYFVVPRHGPEPMELWHVR